MIKGGLVPVTGTDGTITWQQWEYGELVRHLQDDLRLDTTNLPTDVLVRGGVVSLVWAGAVLSGNLVVSHGLGHSPAAVTATSFTAPASGIIPIPNTFAWNPNTFTINADVDGPAFTGTIQVAWLAI